MKKHSIYRKTFILFLLILNFTSCDTENDFDSITIDGKYLTGITQEKHFTKAEIITKLDAAFPQFNIATTPPLAALIKDVDVAAITYTTTGVDGKPTVASGIVAIPTGTTSYNHLLSVQHSTIDMEEAPSRQLFHYEMAPVIANHIVVMADYLGYGISQTSDRQHPYLHIKSTGIVCADMIEAAREYLAKKQIKQLDDKVELIGYSQGGTSTLATLIEIENRGLASTVKSVHAGAGAYDLKATVATFISGGTGDYPRMGYLPYIIRGMSYGEQITLDDTKIYAPTFIEQGVPKIFSTEPLSNWHKTMGTEIRTVMHSDFFFPPLFNNNKDITKLFVALEENSFSRHKTPTTAVKLYHSRLDDFVPYSNTTMMIEKWNNASLIPLTSEGHLAAGVEFLFRYMGLWGIIALPQ